MFLVTYTKVVAPRARVSRYLLALLMLAGLTACQAPVKPWQRQVLAQPGMQFDASDQDLIMDSHFYFSKEGTTGGTGVSAGGCGCN